MSLERAICAAAAETMGAWSSAPIPKYYRLKEAVLERIASGLWPPGSLIPSETEFCREFGISRTTVRKALSDLAHEGRLIALQGKGTFVATPKLHERFLQRAFGLYEDMARRGLHVTTEVLRREVVPASIEVAGRLRITRGEPVNVLVRLRSVDQEKVVVSTTYLPAASCRDLVDHDLSQGSLYQLLRDRYGLVIARGERRLEAVAAGPWEARLLEVALGSPLLLLDSVAYLPDGRPIEYFAALHRGDRISVDVEFFAPEDALTVAPQSTGSSSSARQPQPMELARNG
ncbi:MAG: GntR family transcriptional regulator [Candidatus Dormibacteraeota bacterium]|nr:GntR family transcriptional regulator [Candidatus Dormibacteraeota bacterium]